MSHGLENPLTVKARNARRNRSAQRSVQGNIYEKEHPDRAAEYRRRYKAKKGSFAQQLINARAPLVFTAGDICLACDFHIPCHDESLIDYMIGVCKDLNIRKLAIDGDFLDCDNLSIFTSVTESNRSVSITWKAEKDEGRKIMTRLLEWFEEIYICSGNHENRIIALTGGKEGFKDIVLAMMPRNITISDYERRVHSTTDDFMILNHNCVDENGNDRIQEWMLCHPKNFSILPLRVARALCAKFGKNIHMAHGHNLLQGRDISGRFICIEGGGLFDREALEYTCKTTTHPVMRSGFFILKNGEALKFEGRS
ncbi:MAG: hypothetical protein WCX79_00405 [Candidatus Paceibacterota bacterium]|jgi:hypothetical protein